MDLNLEWGVIQFTAELFPQIRTGSEGELWGAEEVLDESVAWTKSRGDVYC